MPKTIHLIRHAQSTFNAAIDLTGVDPMHPDARLSPLGRQQVAAARVQMAVLDHELIVTSPLTRAIETAMGLFDGGPAPILVEPLAREWLCSSCDVGRSPQALAQAFPALAFDHLEDPWWHVGECDERGIPVEPEQAFLARVAAFRAWLAARPERVVTVVSHGGFLFRLSGHSFPNCGLVTWEIEA
jgi:broad specificity phosphatase PhoE